MIEDFLQFLEYYSSIPVAPPKPYDDPLIRIEYDAINIKAPLIMNLFSLKLNSS